MTITQRKTWKEGKSLWFEYVRLFGYSKAPQVNNIKKMVKLLDLNHNYIHKAMWFYTQH